MCNGNVPKSAFMLCNGQGKRSFYITRWVFDFDTVIGHLEVGRQSATFPLGGVGHERKHYEVLDNVGDTELVWARYEGGEIPRGAVEGGCENEKYASYISRCWWDDQHVIAKFFPHSKWTYFAIEGKERAMQSDCDILCIKSIKC